MGFASFRHDEASSPDQERRMAMNPKVAKLRHAKAAHAKLDRRLIRGGDGRQHGSQGGQEINVGEFERQASMIGGTALAVYGLSCRSLSGLALAILGGALVWRGHTGHCDVYEQLGYSSAEGNDENREPAWSGMAQAQERPPSQEL
jgi:hypothetical protein